MFIKNKILFWFLFPSIVIATVTTVFCYLHTSKVVRKNIFDQLEIAVFELHNNIEIFLSGKQGRTADFSSDGFIKNCTEEIARKDNMREYYTNVLNNHLVTSKKPLDSDILEVFVTDLNGKVISSTDAGLVGRDVSDETYFSETLKSGSYISDIHSHPDYKQNAYFDVSNVLFIKGGQGSIGIIVNRYNGDCLSRVIHRGIKGKLGQVTQPDGWGETGEMYIVNKNKLMITESRFVDDALYNQVVDTEGVRTTFDNRSGMAAIYLDYKDVQVLGVSKYFEVMDWVIVASKHVSEAFASIIYLRNFIIIIGATSIIVIVLVAVFVSTRVTNSITKTTEVTRNISKRDVEKPVMDYRSMDDLKKLGELINSELHKHRQASSYDIRSIKNEDLLLFKIKKSSEEWTIIFDAIPDIITIHDKNYKIVRANKAFYDVFNIDEKQLYDKKCSEIFRCSDTALHKCSLVKCARSSKPEYDEYDDPITGETILLLIYPLLNEESVFQGAIRQQKNITEKKKVDEKMKRSEMFSENLIETAHDAIVCIDEDGSVRVWNHSAEKIFGYSKSEIMGKSITIIIPEKYKKKHEEGLQRFLQTGQARMIGRSIDVFGKTKEGVEVPIGLSLSFQKIGNKRYNFTGIIRDRTFEVDTKQQLSEKSNKLEEYSQVLEQKVESRTLALREANKKLQETDQRKTEFLSVASHELRTPLAAVLGFATIINSRLRDFVFPNVKTDDSKVAKSISKVQRDLDIIILEGRRLTDLINDLLDIEKIESGGIKWKVEHISIADIIKRATALTSGSFVEYGLELISDVEDDLPEIVGDKNRLEQVVINLISNAMKFTQNGFVTCKARKINHYIVISVIDTGGGIPEVDQETIFDKFKQSGTAIKGKQKGTGLGLHICKEIVKHYGGRIWVESEQGKGSTFTFTLPL